MNIFSSIFIYRERNESNILRTNNCYSFIKIIISILIINGFSLLLFLFQNNDFYINNEIILYGKEINIIMKKMYRFLDKIKDNNSSSSFNDNNPSNNKTKNIFLIYFLKKYLLNKSFYYKSNSNLTNNSININNIIFKSSNYFEKEIKPDNATLNFSYFEENNGLIILNLIINFIIKNNKYIAYVNITKLFIEYKISNQISINGNIDSLKINDEIENIEHCPITSEIQLIFNNINNSLIIQSFNLSLNSECGYSFIYLVNNNNTSAKFISKSINKIKRSINIYKEDIKYNLLIISISIINALAVYCLIKSLKTKIYLSSAISIECFILNYESNSYYMFNSILRFMINTYGIKKILYAIGSFFSIVNFLFFDYRFIIIFWQIKRTNSSCCKYYKDWIIFVLYCIFLIIFTGKYFKSSNLFIISISIFIWIPQILHNIIYNNRYIYPLFFIISNTIDKLLFIFFSLKRFRNFPPNKWLIIVLLIFVFFNIIILYLQSFLGPRFMLPLKLQKQNNKFYKTKKEIIIEKPEIKEENCIICFSPLLTTEDSKQNKEDKNKKENKNSNNNIEIKIDNIYNSNRSTVNLKSDIIIQQNTNSEEIFDSNINKINKKHNRNKKKLYSFINNLKKFWRIIKNFIKEGFFHFYKGKNKLFKFYILLSCGHIFHSECLEHWFGVKKECPICRISMEEYF